MSTGKPPDRNVGTQLRGAARLVLDATDGIAGVVESMQRTAASGPDVLGRPLEGSVNRITELFYGSFRGVTRLVGNGLDAALAQLEPWLGEMPSGRDYDTTLAVLNGVLGDYLEQTHNPLATPMRFRRDGRELTLEPDALRDALPRIGGKLVVLVHGSCASDWQWSRLGHDHGEALERDLGYIPLYLHYNSGLHVSTNGRALSALLEQLVSAWPVPVESLTLLAHSLGGLVARSACVYAEARGCVWRQKLKQLVCLGSPHCGAPLERGGNLVDRLLDSSPYTAPLARLGKIRSGGVTDMRYGYVLDEQWQGRDRFARGQAPPTQPRLPAAVACYAAAATRATAPASSLPSDGLVPVDSALGRHATPALSLGFPGSHQWIGFGMNHLDLLSSPAMYEVIRGWLSE